MRASTIRRFLSAATAMAIALATASLVATPASAAITGFRDVGASHPFHDEITWMVESEITGGYAAENRFKPKEHVSREAFAAFLYRLDGRPPVSVPSTSPFSDVSTKSMFYKDIVWLSQQGITTGWSDGTFRPKANITREAMATFLYRYEDEPSFTPPEVSPFEDVATDAPFYKEITWLHSEGMANGWSDGTFRPLTSTTREATAAFLFRRYAPEDYTVPSMIYRPIAVLLKAKAEVGYRAPSSTRSKYNDWIGGNNPWCHVFVQWVFNKTGYKDLVPTHNYFPSWVALLEDAGVLTYNPKASDLTPGTLVLFDWSGNGVPEHVGIVSRASGNRVWAYEGNTTDGSGDPTRGVFFRNRSLSLVVASFDPLDYYLATR